MNVVRQLRIALGWSRKRLAEEIGRSYSSMQVYEAGASIPRDVAVKLLKLADRAGVPEIRRELSNLVAGLSKGDPATVVLPIVGDDNTFHGMLDEVLASNDEEVRLTVKHILRVYSGLASGRKGGG